MCNRTITIIAMLFCAACGTDPLPVEDSPTITSSSSTTASAVSSVTSTSSSTTVSAQGYLNCGICDADTLDGQLVVISQSHYQHKLNRLLGIELHQLDESKPITDLYTGAVARFTGDTLFADDEFRTQRIELAYAAFYQTAERIAKDTQAVHCDNISSEDCANLFIQDFVEPLYERPLSAEESSHFSQFFNQSTISRDEQQRMAMVSALSSPQFLFRKEAGHE